jgi:hypothetical protein
MSGNANLPIGEFSKFRRTRKSANREIGVPGIRAGRVASFGLDFLGARPSNFKGGAFLSVPVG